MIAESSGLCLNIASVPATKKKKAKAKVEVNTQPEPVKVIKPKTFNKKSSSVTSDSVNKSVSSESVDGFKKSVTSAPSGILKKSTKFPTRSVWKKFKQSYKNPSVKPGFVKSVGKPDTLDKEKVKVKNLSAKKRVSFGGETTQEKESVSDSCDVLSEPVFVESKARVKGKALAKSKTGGEGSSFSFLDSNNEKFDSKSNKARKSGDNVKSKKSFEGDTEHKTGKTTSLFGNNPEIPNIPHRAVKPVKEAVFSKLSFEDMDLHPYMVKFLKESMGITQMTTVQEKSIPVLLEQKDALIRSQTGSGKTLAFALPILHKLQEIRPKINRSDGVLVLIVVPTRELALQTYEVFNKLVKSYTWIVPGYLVGGEKRKSEKARLRKGISILIGTPGRLIDHVQHTKALNLDKVSWLVIDEADRMLDLGYEKDVSVLLDTLDKKESSLLHPSYLNPEEMNEPEKEKPKDRQTVLLSATLSQKVEKLAGLSLKNPVFVDACDENLSTPGHVPVFSSDIGMETDKMVLPESLIQMYVVTPPKLKLVTLASFILWKCKLVKEKKMLIFIATQDMVDYHAELLSSIFSETVEEESDSEDLKQFSKSGIELFKLHGNMKQNERTEVFKTFRKSHLGVLLCTDVAARGLDLPEVDWVIQYTGPTSISDYVHRVGRTARGGQSGSSIMFLTPNEVGFIEKLETCQIRLREEKMETCLDHLLSINPQARSVEEEATRLQSSFENRVLQQSKLYDLACKAYASWSRFYASYPRNMRDAFSVKAIHQGHYAKSFALRDPPSVIVKHAKEKNFNGERSTRKRIREKRESEKVKGFQGRSKSLNVSEYDSGLEPVAKKMK